MPERTFPVTNSTEGISSAPPEKLTGIVLDKPKTAAAGVTAVAISMKHVLGNAGLVRGTSAMLNLNQKGGFDCPSCAWPDPEDHRSQFEFCENGAKAIASETTLKRVTPDFFAQYSVAQLSQQSDYWMDQAGRITDPVILRRGSSHYEPISWEAAFDLISEQLCAQDHPDQAIFYTSGRASNEAAFLFQLFARQFGTNNLPDCSNMCHESSGAALNAAIGVGKGTVSLADLESAETILIFGQNPGTNHPRMLSSLQKAVEQGSHIVAINPMKEAGLTGFMHPQQLTGMLGMATPLAQDFLQVRQNGDQALLLALNKTLVEEQLFDADFITTHCLHFDAYREHLETLSWSHLTDVCGIDEATLRRIARCCASGERKVITCWAMGLTQHRNAVATIREVVNLHLLLGAIGRPAAGLCPVRGHSNVQGDRTMGIFEKMPESFHQQIDAAFDFSSPRKNGYDTVAAIQAMHAGLCRVFYALGGNFLQATPDTEYTAEALRRCKLTVHIATKLNRSHLVTGEIGLILPCLGRSEKDNSGGKHQFVTVENSMSVVHQSIGHLRPASKQLMSEVGIIAHTAAATLGKLSSVKPSHPSLPRTPTPWLDYAKDYDLIRDRIAEVLPEFHDFNTRVRSDNGFTLINTAAQHIWKTPSQRAEFSIEGLDTLLPGPDQLVLQTFRSHDQFNTTIYGLDDRYRGISNERRILFVSPQDLKARGISPMQPVDITSHFEGEIRVAKHFLAVPYDLPPQACAGYFPELNSLVPIRSFAKISLTPTSKSVLVTIAPSAASA